MILSWMLCASYIFQSGSTSNRKSLNTKNRSVILQLPPHAYKPVFIGRNQSAKLISKMLKTGHSMTMLSSTGQSIAQNLAHIDSKESLVSSSTILSPTRNTDPGWARGMNPGRRWIWTGGVIRQTVGSMSSSLTA